MVHPAGTRIKTTEYFNLAEYEQHDLIQLIDGEVIITVPPVLKHQMIVSKILYLLMKFVENNGGVAFTAPTEVRLDENNVFEPDVFYITPDNLIITQHDEKRIVGAPNLVVEVLSPGTARFDRQQKYKAYEQHGVNEYWIVDPVHETIEVWTLSTDGVFNRIGSFATDDSFTSTILNEAISVKTIFNS